MAFHYGVPLRRTITAYHYGVPLRRTITAYHYGVPLRLTTLQNLMNESDCTHQTLKICFSKEHKKPKYVMCYFLRRLRVPCTARQPPSYAVSPFYAGPLYKLVNVNKQSLFERFALDGVPLNGPVGWITDVPCTAAKKYFFQKRVRSYLLFFFIF